MENHRGRGSTRTALVIAAVAAVAVGLTLVGIDRASEYDPYWATLLFRGAGVVLLGIVALVVALAGRVHPKTLNLNLPLLIAFGLLDTLANAMWAVASTSGLLSVMAVLGGVYPRGHGSTRGSDPEGAARSGCKRSGW